VLPFSDDGIRQCNVSERAAGVSSHAVAVGHGASRRSTLPTMNAAVSGWAPITLCKSTDSLMLLGLDTRRSHVPFPPPNEPGKSTAPASEKSQEYDAWGEASHKSGVKIA
jgi:hypothetical protein